MNSLASIEAKILLGLQGIRNDFMTSILVPLTEAADNGTMWIIVSGILILIAAGLKLAGYKNRLEYLPLSVGMGGALSLLFSLLFTNLIFKNLIKRIRPYEVIQGLTILVDRQKDTSFPSGHASAAFALAIAVIILVPKKTKWFGVIAVIVAVIIAFSRLYVGVHYPTDVLGGILVGSVSGILSSLIIKESVKRVNRNKTV